MDKIYRQIFVGLYQAMSSCACAQGRSSSLSQVHPIHNLKLLPASTCVYYMCQHMCILHVLARVYTTRASTCVLYTCQHVCLLHVLDYYSKTCFPDLSTEDSFSSRLFLGMFVLQGFFSERDQMCVLLRWWLEHYCSMYTVTFLKVYEVFVTKASYCICLLLHPFSVNKLKLRL